MFLETPKVGKAKGKAKVQKTQPERRTRANQSDVINISDGEEENQYKFPQDDYQFGARYVIKNVYRV